MRPIERSEILPLGAYEEIRTPFRTRIIEAKKSRRVALGDVMTGVFENRDTMLLQIQEMLRTERITQEAGILHEIETYNELVPGSNELSMTLTIEIADRDQRESMLTALAGLETKIILSIAGRDIRALGEDRSVEGIRRTTAVHYFKFSLTPEASSALSAPDVVVTLRSEHPAYGVSATLSKPVVASLRADLVTP